MSIDTGRFQSDLEERRRCVMAVIEHREHNGSLEDDIGELVSSSADNHLAEIDAALGRIANGTYGLCEVCGREIDEERLEAVPWTTLCIDDKRKRERR